MKTNQQTDSTTIFLEDGIGYTQHRRGGVATFDIVGTADLDTERQNGFREIYKPLIREDQYMQLDGFRIPLWGDAHNLYPQEVQALIQDNKLLPSILRKQEEFLYGKGPYLYREVIEDGKQTRVAVQSQEIQWWLESWEANGYNDYRDYLRCLIQDYYRVHTCCSQWHFSRGRRDPLTQAGSIRALSYIGADEARLAVNSQISTVKYQLRNRDCRFVAVGDWTRPTPQNIDIYNRFRADDPFRFSSAISFNAEKTFAKQVYAYNHWFEGLREWIRASNLTPRYLNSYLKNALNAHVHVRIPVAWVNLQQQNLQELCRQNMGESDPARRHKEYRGVRLIDPQTKKPYRYSVSMIEDLIAAELDKITRLLAGEGKNQGKLYATTKVGQEGWEFQEFPGKFKEYFESLLAYDKRADQVTLAGIGINSSITNVENDGVISKSGSDVYYNYMVYMATLTYPEEFICKDLNRAISLNFPHLAMQQIRIGFRQDIPMRQQEVSPKDRL